MNIFNHFFGIVEIKLKSLAAAGTLPGGLDASRVTVEPPRDPSHGDLSTNAAMVLAKQTGVKPRDLAEQLAEQLRGAEAVEAVAVAGPGFINLRLTNAFWYDHLGDILRAGRDYGRSDLGAGRKVNVEYVSANPTGPLTVGHARGAVVGDALAGLLEKAGFDVTREYYINDAGGQVDTLARTAHLRYREALGETIGEIPAGLYPGAYMRDVGRALAERDGNTWLNQPETAWLPEVRRFAIEVLMRVIKDDLHALGVDQSVFTSERSLVEAGAVERVFASLEGRDLLYVGVLEPPKGKTPEDWEPRPQTLFKATSFGDDVDRPLKKSDGSWTYFANDMANHFDKYRRGFTRQIDVWGADHGGYVKRMQAAVKALTEERATLEIVLCQLVKLSKGGVEVKMSKRSGSFVTLRELIDDVGKDVVRFIMLTRKSDAQLDFDLEKVLEQSRDNPVFYVQYAHARAHSVLRHAAAEFPDLPTAPEALATSSLARLTDSAELALIRQMANWPRVVEQAATASEPHRVAFYLQDLAAAFHTLWTKGNDDARLRFLIADDLAVTTARLALVKALAETIASGLAVMGVEPVTEMR
ncbi:arginine--tRNA ligase [Algihabitans albus]|uniref:arginine--tRNA ligase n=1 Tax=Algihabitans albus TaxID=2164067 RepID=UPI000E5D978A|nr:arginine--tRNA ligase [Algihabitans albus]